MNIGFIGVGNMGFAMLNSVRKMKAGEIVYTDVSQERLDYIKKETTIDYLKSNQQVVDHSDIIVLAIKPQYMAEVLLNLTIDSRKIIISIAPGLSIAYINSLIVGSPKIVRAMPNTPALIGEGISAVSFGEMEFNGKQKEEVYDIFRSLGKVITVPESQMDAIVPLSGSSPAFVYMLIEAMADAGVSYGINRADAYLLASQAVIGAGKMVQQTGLHPGQLKDQVTSPKGTTIAGLKELEQTGFRGSIIAGMEACYQQTKQMSKDNNR